jgi:hypothetical protein
MGKLCIKNKKQRHYYFSKYEKQSIRNLSWIVTYANLILSKSYRLRKYQIVFGMENV